MQCFTHQASSAVAICKSCGRAICASCAKDLQFAVVCSAACATQANEARELEQKGKMAYGVGSVQRRVPTGAMIYAIAGSAFILLSLAPLAVHKPPEIVALLIGTIFVGIGAFVYRRYKSIGLQT
jgi:hypothetical protein